MEVFLPTKGKAPRRLRRELLLNKERRPLQELRLNRYGEIIGISSVSIDKVRRCGSMQTFTLRCTIRD